MVPPTPKPPSTPRGIRNCNPLNIRRGSAWLGLRKEQTDPAFCQFDTMVYGCRAAIILACNYIKGTAPSCRGHRCTTVTSFITHWAPPTENNTPAYIRRVCDITGYKPTTTLYVNDHVTISILLWAMAQVECGQTVPLSIFDLAWAIVDRVPRH